MAPVNGGFLHYIDMKKFLENFHSGEWGLLARYGHEEILRKSSSLKRLVRFEIISQECSFGDPFQKLFEILIHQQTWLW